MSFTLSPAPWPAPAPQAPASARRFGVPVTLVGPDGPESGWQWLMKRNCSLAPGQLLRVYLSMCVVSLAIAVGFYLQGASFVLYFAGFELLLLGIALLVYGRHAADQESITLVGRRVEVIQWQGSREHRAEFRAEWLVVEPSAGQGSLLDLSAQGQRVRVGRFLRPDQRAAFAQELRQALRRARLYLSPEPSGSETKYAR